MVDLYGMTMCPGKEVNMLAILILIMLLAIVLMPFKPQETELIGILIFPRYRETEKQAANLFRQIQNTNDCSRVTKHSSLISATPRGPP